MDAYSHQNRKKLTIFRIFTLGRTALFLNDTHGQAGNVARLYIASHNPMSLDLQDITVVLYFYPIL